MYPLDDMQYANPLIDPKYNCGDIIYLHLRDAYVSLKSHEDWIKLVSALRSVESLDHLYLSLRSAKILPRDFPAVLTKVGRLSINYCTCPHSSAKNILSAFENVEFCSLYSVQNNHSQQVENGRRGSKVIFDSFSGHVSLTSGKKVWEDLSNRFSYSQLRHYPLITQLTINNLGDQVIDLSQLVTWVGGNLKILEVVVDQASGRKKRMNSVDPTQISVCFTLPKIETIRIREACPEGVERWVRLFDQVKPLPPFKGWPVHLKEIVVSEWDFGQYVRIADYGFGIQIVHDKKRSYDELGFAGPR